MLAPPLANLADGHSTFADFAVALPARDALATLRDAILIANPRLRMQEGLCKTPVKTRNSQLQRKRERGLDDDLVDERSDEPVRLRRRVPRAYCPPLPPRTHDRFTRKLCARLQLTLPQAARVDQH